MSRSPTPGARARALEDLLNKIDKDCSIHPHAHQLLLDIADEFIDSVTDFSSELAKHRKSKVLETKDLKLCLEKHWGIHIPGFGPINAQPPPVSSKAHQERLSLKRKHSEVEASKDEERS